MIIDRRALAGAALGVGASLAAEAKESETVDEGVTVQRIYGANGTLISVDASTGAGQDWAPLLSQA